MLTVGEPARPTEVRRGNAASEPVLRKFRERILSEMRAPWNGEWKTRTDPRCDPARLEKNQCRPWGAALISISWPTAVERGATRSEETGRNASTPGRCR
jgi:hypothetical protein